MPELSVQISLHCIAPVFKNPLKQVPNNANIRLFTQLDRHSQHSRPADWGLSTDTRGHIAAGSEPICFVTLLVNARSHGVGPSGATVDRGAPVTRPGPSGRRRTA